MDQSNEAANLTAGSGQAIVIVPYRAALGSLALRIDHIGSTSVRGLAAKDIIDIQVTVQALEEPVERALQTAGYARRERRVADHVPPGQPDTPAEWTKWLFRPAASTRRVNLHVRVAGRLNQRYPLLFRDYLRTHASMAEAYARTKTTLARYYAEDRDTYTDVKDPVCDIIMAAAEEWAVTESWQPGPSDA